MATGKPFDGENFYSKITLRYCKKSCRNYNLFSSKWNLKLNRSRGAYNGGHENIKYNLTVPNDMSQPV